MAAEKTRGNTLAAVEALKKYLEVHAGDKDAWEEMGDLYLEVGGGLANACFIQ